METEKFNFDIVFESLESYKEDSKLTDAFKIYNDSKTIFEQADLLKSLQPNDVLFESIGYTKA